MPAATALKSADPLATPLSAIAQQQPLQQLKRDQPEPEMPVYAELLKELQDPSNAPPLSTIYEDRELQQASAEPQQHSFPPQPIVQPHQQQHYQQPHPQQQQAEFQPAPSAPPASQRPVYAVMPAPGAAPKKAASFSLDANKHLLVLLVIVALALHVVAPRMRTYPRFTSGTGIGLSLAGVFVLATIIVLTFRIITYAAGMASV